MKEISKDCERAGDLVSVLYGEATEREQRDFELHLKQCEHCRAEFASFAQVRDAVGEWRDEALTGFVSSPVVAAPPRKSAIAALRQFFDLSPLWLKGAVGFAAVVFCALLVLAFGRFSAASREVPSQVAVKNPAAVFTKEDVDRAVDQALTRQQAVVKKEREERLIEAPEPRVALVNSGSKSSTVAKSTRVPQSRRPFSRAEREQLAAELRLVSSDDSELIDK
jgi:hypothetical protein